MNYSRHRVSDNRSKSYWLYGVHAVTAGLQNPARKVKRILLAKNAAEKIELWLEARHPKPEMAETQALTRIAGEEAIHQGVLAEVQPLDALLLEDILNDKAQKPLLLLDQVTDPHNVGAILRSAAAFDAGAVIVTRDHAPEESAVLARSASGGLEIVPFVAVTNLAQTMETLKKAGYWCIGLDGEAKQTIAQANLGKKSALILGAEGQGLRRLTAERCDLLVRLPICARMESLNVSNAAAIALYELSRGA